MSPEFEQLYAKYFGAALARQHALADLIGDNDWNLSLDTGTLSFGPDLAFPAQLLGTESEHSGTWLWAWANERIEPAPGMLDAALKLRAYGERHNVPELTTPHQTLDDVDGFKLAMVGVGLCGADACYRGPYDGGAVLVLMTGTPLAGPLRTPKLRRMSIITEISRVGFANPKAAIQAYLEQEGEPVKSHPNDAFEIPGGPTLRFDAQGRVELIEGKLDPPQP
jgi:hypothetical protein